MLFSNSKKPLFCNPVDLSPSGSSVRGISQARILEWVAISFSRGSSRPKIKPSLLHCKQFFTSEPSRKPCLVFTINISNLLHKLNTPNPTRSCYGAAPIFLLSIMYVIRVALFFVTYHVTSRRGEQTIRYTRKIHHVKGN